MILLDDNTPTLIAAAAAQKPDTIVPKDEFGQMVHAQDSISTAIKDSLRNMDVSDLKAVVTGENTILRDGLRELTQLTVQFVPKLLVAILILWIGFKLVKMLKRVIMRGLDRRNAEPSLKSFLGSLTDVLLKAMIIIMAMDVIGIKATSFIALLGAMGLAVGMALQGTLQNFAGGVIILLMKPFKVDDYIECGSYKGYIKEIRIFHTIMRPFNGRTIIVPNSELSNKSLISALGRHQGRATDQLGPQETFGGCEQSRRQLRGHHPLALDQGGGLLDRLGAHPRRHLHSLQQRRRRDTLPAGHRAQRHRERPHTHGAPRGGQASRRRGWRSHGHRRLTP